ncbi:N-acylneuraminate cytidylyltransferase/CMP-N,N'-diacetyllegionaminic acid synthase [Clostridium tetanomorphum]|uniref:acylneuraminate cytidylyltransferase family protein n=1 Tax=Clostridium tetanomorphum TaxID=1553 RepID=UPI000446D0BE|nr:acylneuraminate cytidylyltransferase family protein [Clostridium tetanomorphum]KAJ52334.1 N-acylneuraminate cytidylyltransferase [Clostridium tetanomorphum DSM 665]MBP1865255.1 N-acylneuraminate cytidylyltransferase/CMP-N,N'-diacetyllegionaminic acid synthase [Clostridium tetanomorphum]NRS85178.1 N-acylneuraminate cytidylyltransferase/CMP-N,N'-diacetyllegionaminic acid synthase [Clostridium tetanomorphum]SQC03113.1 N-acylneuraminate cytidylyltransferase [Clostridium tetanomorphum]
MINNKRILAIIPARGGSKGIPRKNVKDLNGKPLIAYTIEEGIKSKYIDELIVSTEDEEIASVSKAYGAEVPYLRPEEFSKDETPGIYPIIHGIEYFDKKNNRFDYVVCLQCTSPFRKAYQIDEAIEKLIEIDADSIVSVCENEVSPYWMKKIVDGKMTNFLEESTLYARRQDVPKLYRLNGAIYIAKKHILMNFKNWYTENTIPYIMDEKTSLDIDNMMDFKFAQFLIKERENG